MPDRRIRLSLPFAHRAIDQRPSSRVNMAHCDGPSPALEIPSAKPPYDCTESRKGEPSCAGAHFQTPLDPALSPGAARTRVLRADLAGRRLGAIGAQPSTLALYTDRGSGTERAPRARHGRAS